MSRWNWCVNVASPAAAAALSAHRLRGAGRALKIAVLAREQREHERALRVVVADDRAVERAAERRADRERAGESPAAADNRRERIARIIDRRT